ncbi:hypothetical protein [Sphingosinicella rhizophila]|uniref:Uncharacterized protein n=1 Tax=Sphingosinicella rhizophila TaxID=3050082 RepID=A0ABU3Q8X5_9SPHN|nr:hypothetical protein [Sphingosinicella sp. GR2756]MDT9599859.1 hypothetical protein [Sphingosinicella sp. GR2756]
MPMSVLIAGLLAAAQASPPAEPAIVEISCPIGGASFDYVRPVPEAVTGLRPDGKPYSGATYPPALPECPDNGLVLYKDYDEAEIAKLKPVIESADYQAQRGTDTAYYRAYRLMRVLGEAPDDYLWTLLQASWEADDRPELRTRYLTELVEAAAEVPARPEDLNWIGMEARTVNALRELGRFNEARARLASLPLASLDVAVPEAGKASEAEIRSARSRRNWSIYFKLLAGAIDRWDASMEPPDMIPRTVALARCADKDAARGDTWRTFCDAQASAAPAAEQADPGKEMEVLRRPRKESGR